MSLPPNILQAAETPLVLQADFYQTTGPQDFDLSDALFLTLGSGWY